MAAKRKPRILAIDDEETTRLILTAMLSDKGYQVLALGDPEAGIRHALEGNVDLVILDLMMPKVDGWQVLSRLRGQQVTKNIPVLLLTGDERDESIRKAFSMQRTDYLLKPIDQFHLLHKVSRLISSKV